MRCGWRWEALLSAIIDACLVVYASAGHDPHEEEPERFASDVTSFVESVIAGGSR